MGRLCGGEKGHTVEVKESFILYTYIKGQVNALTDEEAGLLLKAVLAYVSGDPLPDLPRVRSVVFIGIKNDIDRASEKWEETRKRKSEGGKRSADVKSKKTEENKFEEYQRKKAILFGDGL